MNTVRQTHPHMPQLRRVASGEDQFGEYRGIGTGAVAFKVSSPDPNSLFIVEITLHQKGGPARHLHHDQDEWFYAIEGQFILEVGQEQVKLSPGDSLLVPREIPHAWAYLGDSRGRLLVTFNHAGKMAAFFREISKANAMAPQDPDLWRAHGMELIGPPLPMA